jgi:redox-sensitive bicupin YhaK (pirin superfamily)
MLSCGCCGAKNIFFFQILPNMGHTFTKKLNCAYNDSLADALHAVVFNNDGERITIDALEHTHVLLLSGEPLNEKVVSYGPFVMNHETQILEAMRDYQKGKMGILIEN